MNLSTPKQSKTIANPLSLSKYYAGFSPTFVNDAIKALGISPKHILLDPWAGQGTTGWVAQNIGISSILVDLNPVMSIYSCAADLNQIFETGDIDLRLVIEELFPVSSIKNKQLSIIPVWAPKRLWSLSNSIITFLLKQGLFTNGRELNNKLGIIAAAVFLLLKKYIQLEPTTNPTHFKIYQPKTDYNGTFSNFRKLLIDQVISLIDNKAKYVTNGIIGTVKVFNSDSKKLPIANESADYVITSPPYCTRIDYAKLTTVELSLLESCAFSSLFEVRKEQMGTPVVCPIVSESMDNWGKTCKSILLKIYNHSSHGSRNYYYKIFLKYFSDAYSSILEIRRCLVPHGEGLLVVQNSYYKELEIPLSKVYIEMLSIIGFNAKIVSRNSSKNVLAHRNRSSNKYINDLRVYFEDVIHFYKGKK